MLTHISSQSIFLALATLSLSETTPVSKLPFSLSASSPPPVGLSAELMGQRKFDLMYAGCGNLNTHAKNAHAAETMNKYLGTLYPKKVMWKHVNKRK